MVNKRTNLKNPKDENLAQKKAGNFAKKRLVCARGLPWNGVGAGRGRLHRGQEGKRLVGKRSLPVAILQQQRGMRVVCAHL